MSCDNMHGSLSVRSTYGVFLTLSDVQSMVARHASSVAFSPSFLQVIDANTRDSCTRKRVALINILFDVLSLPSA